MDLMWQPWLMLKCAPRKRRVLYDGKVIDESQTPTDPSGAYNRPASVFRQQDIPAADVVPGRWHIFACYGCPWAHRAIILRDLKGLQETVPLITTAGWWPFTRGLPAICTSGWRVEAPMPSSAFKNASPELKAEAKKLPFELWRLYVESDEHCTGRVTVPVLWDAEKAQVVNNESSEVIRMLNSTFSKLGAADAPDLYPEELREEIDMVNHRIYGSFNNGVYRCGFAASEEAYETAAKEVSEALRWMEDRLKTRRYLCGEHLTESDVRCYTTLIRFDGAYRNAFRCNKSGSVRRNFPQLQRYLRSLYSMQGFKESTDGMLFGYPLMYFAICRWPGRRMSNLLRLLECAIFGLFGGLAPTCPDWRYDLLSWLCTPLRLLNRLYFDPLPDVGGLL
mmetsp:Transcript_10034/g.22151  ORF Transcript_10034/g.22151 Transcript_10034/m.22151 type:complete len:393 (+) Transcript_10034:109-1287(+)